MARYKCTQCGTIGENTTCLNCQSTKLRKLDEEPAPDALKEAIEQQSAALTERRPASGRSVAPSAAPASASDGQKSTPEPSAPRRSSTTPTVEPAQRHQRPALVESIPPPPGRAVNVIAEAPPQQSEIVNLDQFEALLKRGVKAVIMCGGGQVGKSEIAAGFTRARRELRGIATMMTLGVQSGVRYDVALGGTAPNSVWYQLIDRRRVFLDPSGEFFAQFSERRRQVKLGGITESHFDFVRSAVQKLAGLVLVIDLTNTEDLSADNAWQEQEAVSAFTLGVVRWLRFNKKARYEELELTTRIGLALEETRRKLDVPVLVLFSKADRLAEHDFTSEHPLALARRRLPMLHAALLTHARKFRFDYVHTMVPKDGLDRPAKYPCGVLLSMEWLLDDPLRWLPPLPTSLLGGGK